MIPPGLEPGTLRVLGARDNRYTTESRFHEKEPFRMEPGVVPRCKHLPPKHLLMELDASRLATRFRPLKKEPVQLDSYTTRWTTTRMAEWLRRWT